MSTTEIGDNELELEMMKARDFHKRMNQALAEFIGPGIVELETLRLLAFSDQPTEKEEGIDYDAPGSNGPIILGLVKQTMLTLRWDELSRVHRQISREQFAMRFAELNRQLVEGVEAQEG